MAATTDIIVCVQSSVFALTRTLTLAATHIYPHFECVLLTFTSCVCLIHTLCSPHFAIVENAYENMRIHLVENANP